MQPSINKLLSVLISGTLFLCFASQANEICKNDLSDIQSSIYSYIYLIRNDPENFDELIKNSGYNFKTIQAIDNSLSLKKISQIKLDFSFIENIILSQNNGLDETLSAPLTRDANSKLIIPESSVFIVSGTPKFDDKVLLILSNTRPVNTEIVSIDKCLNAKLLFYSKNFDFDNYNKLHNQKDTSSFEKEPMGNTIEKVSIKRGLIKKYIYKNKQPYILDDLITR